MHFRNPATQPPFAIVTEQPRELPVGSVIAYAGTLASVASCRDWLYCDGSSVLKAAYPELYLALGDTYGKAASDAFLLPDYRGYFHRGLDTTDHTPQPTDPQISSRTNSAGESYDGVGSIQQDAFEEHEHCYNAPSAAGQQPSGFVAEPGASPLNVQSTATSAVAAASSGGQPCGPAPPASAPRTAPETRSKNIYVYYLIKACREMQLFQVPCWPSRVWPWR